MKVAIVDDHTIVREGLATALQQRACEVVAQAKNIKEAMAFIAQSHPDTVLIDLNLPDGNGLEIVTWIRKISQTMGIVILTMNDEDDFLLASMNAGANAYITKGAPISDVISALNLSVQAPGHFTASGLSNVLARKKETFGLSPRELEVLTLLPQGATAREMGKQLFLSEPTIKTHMANIYRKLGVTNRTTAIAKARTSGLLKER